MFSDFFLCFITDFTLFYKHWANKPFFSSASDACVFTLAELMPLVLLLLLLRLDRVSPQSCPLGCPLVTPSPPQYWLPAYVSVCKHILTYRNKTKFKGKHKTKHCIDCFIDITLLLFNSWFDVRKQDTKVWEICNILDLSSHIILHNIHTCQL